MSGPNKNKKIIELNKNENSGACCSSSTSGSSNSDEGDTSKNLLIDSLKMVTGVKVVHDVLKGGNEPSDICEFAPRTLSAGNAVSNGFLSDMRIAKILSLDSKENEFVLVVDVTPRTATLVGMTAKSIENSSSTTMTTCAESERQEVLPKKKFYKVNEEMVKDLCRKGLQIYEWSSFKKPGDVVDLLVNENTSRTTINEFFSRNMAPKRCAGSYLIDEPCKKRKRGTGCDVAFASKRTNLDSRLRRRSTSPVDQDQVEDGQQQQQQGSRMEGKNGISKQPQLMDNIADQRTRLLQHILKEYSIARARRTQQQYCHYRVPQLKMPNEFESRKRAANSWLSRKNISVLKNTISNVNLLLNDDSVTGVSNNTSDTNTTDGNDAANSSNNEDSDSKIKKKNRCVLCRKKVGLTGFECRCGGLYCGIHRYSDKHNCTFDYRQLGAQEIRRNNPVVIGEKIQKI